MDFHLDWLLSFLVSYFLSLFLVTASRFSHFLIFLDFFKTSMLPVCLSLSISLCVEFLCKHLMSAWASSGSQVSRSCWWTRSRIKQEEHRVHRVPLVFVLLAISIAVQLNKYLKLLISWRTEPTAAIKQKGMERSKICHVFGWKCCC